MLKDLDDAVILSISVEEFEKAVGHPPESEQELVDAADFIRGALEVSADWDTIWTELHEEFNRERRI